MSIAPNDGACAQDDANGPIAHLNEAEARIRAANVIIRDNVIAASKMHGAITAAIEFGQMNSMPPELLAQLREAVKP